MATLRDSEKQELLELSRSSELREDMQHLRQNLGNKPASIDEYIEFLNEMNAMLNHKPKKFRKITGESFLL